MYKKRLRRSGGDDDDDADKEEAWCNLLSTDFALSYCDVSLTWLRIRFILIHRPQNIFAS